MLYYKGFAGVLEVDEEDGLLHGHVVGANGGVTFIAETVAQARVEFAKSVDIYLDFCKRQGKETDRSFSGKFTMRVPPALHRTLAIAAEARKESIIETVRAACELALERWQIPIEELAGTTVEVGGPAAASAPISAKPSRKSAKRKPSLPAAAAKE